MYLFIDTDIGDDIDDNLTIGLALKKNLNVVGITTVYGDSVTRANVARGLLACAKRTDIPVFAGYSKPMSQKARELAHIHYDVGAAQTKGEEDPEKAVDFLIECAKRYQSELTLLSIGAQTNIAKAYQKAPEIMKNIGKCVIMGGAFFVHNDEWNIACDPLAAKIVSESGMPITYVPWDVTRHIDIGIENCEYILNNTFDEVGEFIAQNVRVWRKKTSSTPLLHDPTALYYCLKPESFTERKIRVKFIAEGEFTGMSLNLDMFTGFVENRNACPLVNVVLSANNDEIIRDFMATLFDKRIV